jgi:hypothetical protein
MRGFWSPWGHEIRRQADLGLPHYAERGVDYRNDDLVVDSIVPRLAHELYPNLFRTDQAFSTASNDIVYLMNDRVQEMIDVVREASGKEHIIFIVDEIGNMSAASRPRFLDLHGLAQNLKDLGNGKVWIVGTAQQTLTEDDPRAAINSPELYKLKDRFPITVALESSDIKEICFRRLLGSPFVQLRAQFHSLICRHVRSRQRHKPKDHACRSAVLRRLCSRQFLRQAPSRE